MFRCSLAARRAGRACVGCGRPRRLSTPSSDKPVTPDFTTSVNVADIKLSRPQSKPKPKGSWSGLEGLKERTQGSLVESTLKEMETDDDFQTTAKRLREVGAKRMSLEERKRRRRALDQLGLPDFWQTLEDNGVADQLSQRRAAEVFQINIGLFCNQACSHCHVESSPKRSEAMSAATADRVLHVMEQSPSVHTLDVTGGAPELSPEFRRVVSEVRNRQSLSHVNEIIDRCNLTVLTEPGQEDLADFLADNRVRVVASLPCYSAKNVNQQRGRGVFDRSIQALRDLNERGYGREDSGLFLDLVYNPLGAFLPPPQEALEEKYREELGEAFGVEFNNLFTITNMPIKRFADFLHRRGELEAYMELLVRNFNADTVGGLMCSTHVNVSWDGKLYDCDFNQQLQLGAGTFKGEGRGIYRDDGLSVFDIESTDDLAKTEIVVDNHCFGCTAGMGSS